MRFGPVPVGEAAGAVAAHGVQARDEAGEPVVVRKGDVVTPLQAEALARAGVRSVVVARLDPGDVGENVAARRLAEAVAGPGLWIERAFTGRANLFASAPGVLLVDADAVERVNAVDERLTLATLPPFRAVEEGEMVGTVKVIPFAVDGAVLERAVREVDGPSLRLSPYRARRVGVVSTLLPGLKPSVVAKTLRVLDDRLAPTGSRVAAEERVPHEAGALAEALRRLVRDHDLLIVYGASAIADRRDVIPTGVERAGGTVDHLGMPVDPGNLLMMGRIGAVPVLGAPGCARSPKENGFDWVLQRLLADVPVAGADIRRLGAGGLLMEIVSRPQPRGGASREDEP
ncbi:molybdopterin-binding protein [Lichenibacterium minor]|uniref:molybdopterin-binding protein n=1 Tax=Lichenibacterium minor TaxID=2316528 RepID=UPI001FE0861B|nr:molybdopterin-binding protein [Lichenibacterium minor]